MKSSNSNNIFHLIRLACSASPNSCERKEYLDKLVKAIIQEGKLWRDNSPHYENALSDTWLYMFRNLCEAVTVKKSYDPSQSRITTWLNAYLKGQLLHYECEAKKRKKHEISSNTPLGSGDEESDLTLEEILPAPPEVPNMLEEAMEWAITDADGELSRVHMRGREDITAQRLILEKLSPGTKTWGQLSVELGSTITGLYGFYERECHPRLRRFGEEKGYLEN